MFVYREHVLSDADMVEVLHPVSDSSDDELVKQNDFDIQEEFFFILVEMYHFWSIKNSVISKQQIMAPDLGCGET